MTPFIHPEVHRALHRLRQEETAEGIAFAETPAVLTTAVKEGAGR